MVPGFRTTRDLRQLNSSIVAAKASRSVDFPDPEGLARTSPGCTYPVNPSNIGSHPPPPPLLFFSGTSTDRSFHVT